LDPGGKKTRSNRAPRLRTDGRGRHSTAVLLHAWVSAAATAAVLAVAFARRIRREEAVLGEDLGEAYRSYRREVAAILPGVW